MPNLRFSTQQFEDGASADGSRIDRALEELRQAFNAVLPMHLRRRHLPVVVCGGYRPHGPYPSTPADQFPFVASCNRQSRVVGGAGTIENVYRSKGTAQSGMDEANEEGLLYAWEIPLAFPDGGIFDGLFYYTGMMVWPAAPIPPNKTAGQSVDDLSIELQVASPVLPMKRRMSAQEVLKRDFKVESFNINRNGAAALSTDFYPSSGGGNTTTYGCHIEVRGLNIPIPIGGVARLVFTLPDYTGTGYNSAWGNKPWWSQTSWAASLLKPLRR